MKVSIWSKSSRKASKTQVALVSVGTDFSVAPPRLHLVLRDQGSLGGLSMVLDMSREEFDNMESRARLMLTRAQAAEILRDGRPR